MIKLKALEAKAFAEIKETSERVISSFVKLAEEAIYNELKLDVAENGCISKETYEVEIPFNPRMDGGFETKRSVEHGMTNKELLEKVVEQLNENGYEAQSVDNEFGEQSVLKVTLKAK